MLQCGLFRSNFSFAISRLSLPRKTSQPKTNLRCDHPRRGNPIEVGAGDGNRTHVASLEGWCSTIELHPPGSAAADPPTASVRRPRQAFSTRRGSREALVEGVGFEPT